MPNGSLGFTCLLYSVRGLGSSQLVRVLCYI